MVGIYLLVTSQLHQDVLLKSNESPSQEQTHGVSSVLICKLSTPAETFLELFMIEKSNSRLQSSDLS